MRCRTTPRKRNKPLAFVWLLFLKEQLCGYLTENFKWTSIISYAVSRRQQCKCEPIWSVCVAATLFTPSRMTTGDAFRLPFLTKCVDCTDGELSLYSPRYSYRAFLEHQGPNTLSTRQSCIHRQLCCLKVLCHMEAALKRLTAPLVIYPEVSCRS